MKASSFDLRVLDLAVDFGQQLLVVLAFDRVVGKLLGCNLASGEARHVHQHEHFRDAGGSGGPDAMMTRDYFQPSFRLGAQRQALKALVTRDGLGQPLKHRLGHRAGVHILLAQSRGVNLPKLQAVAEFQDSLGLDYGRRACGVSLSRPSCKVFTVCGFWAIGGLHRAHSRATLSLPDTECLREGPPARRAFAFVPKLA